MQEITAIMYFKDYVEYLPESIDGLINQMTDWKLIIIDAGTSGLPDKYTHSIPNIYVMHDEMNVASFNKAIERTDTPYYIPLCADDILNHTYFSLAEQILDLNPHIDIVSCDIEKFGNESGIWRSSGLTSDILSMNTMFCSSVVRKTLWEKLGGYDVNLPHLMYDDWDFWARAYKIGARDFHIPLPLYKWRSHDRNVSTHNPDKTRETLEYMKRKGVIV